MLGRFLLLIILTTLTVGLSAEQIRLRLAPAAAGGGGLDTCDGGEIPIDDDLRPRLILSPCNIDVVVTNVSAGGARNTDFEGTYVPYFDGSMYGTGNYNDGMGQAVMIPAFMYLMASRTTGVTYTYTAAQYAEEAERILNLYTVGAADGGSLIWGPILAYDWIRDYAGLDAGNVAAWKTWLCTIENSSEAGNGPFNERISLIRVNKILAALTLQHDTGLSGGCQSWVTAEIAAYATKWRSPTGVSQMESDYVGVDGGDGNGRSYGPGHEYWENTLAELAYQSANAISWASHWGTQATDYYKGQAIGMLRGTHPFGSGTDWRWVRGFYMAGGSGVLEWEYIGWLTLVRGIHANLGNTSDAGLAQWTMENRTGDLDDYATSLFKMSRWTVAKFVVSPTTPTAVSPTTYGLAVNKCTLFAGECQFRADWTSTNSPLVLWYRGKWKTADDRAGMWGVYEHYRNGPAVTNCGSGGHDFCGEGTSSMAQNRMHFVFRDVTFPSIRCGIGVQNCGAPRRPLTTLITGSGDFDEDSIYDMLGKNGDAAIDQSRTVIADFSTNYGHYLLGDFTRAWDSGEYTSPGGTSHLTSMVEEMVIFPAQSSLSSTPDVVFQRNRATVPDTDIQINRVVRLSGVPTVTGSSANSTNPSRGGHSVGHTQYTCTSGACVATATNTTVGPSVTSNNKTAITFILPASGYVHKIGGSNVNGSPYVRAEYAYTLAELKQISGTTCELSTNQPLGFIAVDTITVSGADQTEYNVQAVTATSMIDANTLRFTCTGTPGATPATGTNLMAWASAGQRATNIGWGSSCAISTIAVSGATVVVDCAAVHNLTTGDIVTISGVTPHAFNRFQVAATVTDTDSFTYAVGSASGSGATNGGMYMNEPPSHEFEDAYGFQNDWVMPLGTAVTTDHGQYTAAWRLEWVNQTAGTTTDDFLLCYEVMPSSSATPATCTGAASANMGYVRYSNTRGWSYPLSGINNTNCGSACSFTVTTAGTYKWKITSFNPSSSRTVDPDANCTVQGGSAGASASVTMDSQGHKELDIVATASCVVTVS